MVVGRLRGDAQPLPDLLGREAARQPAEHFGFSVGQSQDQAIEAERLEAEVDVASAQLPNGGEFKTSATIG
jgi:hypothetical protein